MNNIDLFSYEQNNNAAFNKLSPQQQLLVQQRVSSEKASSAVAWLLWIFLGMYGGHRFYLKRSNAALMLILTIIGYVTCLFIIGIFFLIATWIWWIVDAFHINRYLKENYLKTMHDSILFITGRSVEEINGGMFNGMNQQQMNFGQPGNFNQPVNNGNFNQPAGNGNFNQPVNNGNNATPAANNSADNSDADQSAANNASANNDDQTDFSKPANGKNDSNDSNK